MRKLYSPLRYPGGKAKVLEFMKELIKKNFSKTKPAYIEPYAGGAAVALGLLIEDYVTEIYINDFDKAIYSFWQYCVKNNSKKFIKKIIDTEVTIEEWFKQSEIYNNPNSKIGFDLGFSAFFLNRCNRSGILKGGGVIGGKSQQGQYKLNCRFNKEDLIKRIETIVALKDKIHVYNKDAKHLLTQNDLKNLLKNSLLYLDPPYYKQGKKLYKNYYKHSDHKEISKIMKQLHTKWVVSYDNQEEICNLYNNFEKREFNLTYFAGYQNNKREKNGKEVMFFSDQIRKIPNINIIDNQKYFCIKKK